MAAVEWRAPKRAFKSPRVTHGRFQRDTHTYAHRCPYPTTTSIIIPPAHTRMRGQPPRCRALPSEWHRAPTARGAVSRRMDIEPLNPLLPQRSPDRRHARVEGGGDERVPCVLCMPPVHPISRPKPPSGSVGRPLSFGRLLVCPPQDTCGPFPRPPCRRPDPAHTPPHGAPLPGNGIWRTLPTTRCCVSCGAPRHMARPRAHALACSSDRRVVWMPAPQPRVAGAFCPISRPGGDRLSWE